MRLKVIFVGLFFFLNAIAAQSEATAEAAAPFGVKIEESGACLKFLQKYPTKVSKNLFTVGAGGTLRQNDYMHEVLDTEALYPGARRISISCNGGNIWQLTITGNKTRPMQLDAAIALAALKEKYKFFWGDRELSGDSTSSTFTSGRVEITFNSSMKEAFYTVQYLVHESPPYEIKVEEMKRLQLENERNRKQKSAL